MIRRRLPVIFVVAVLAAGAAFAVRTLIYQTIIVPMAYLWWTAGLYYRLVPQAFVWVALILIILFTAGRSLLMEIPSQVNTGLAPKAVAGPVETLSVLLHKRRRGIYYKWLIANRLGELTRELLDQREGQKSVKRFVRIIERDWNPPEEISAYLEVGLNGSFADYPRGRWMRPRSTPLDENPQDVIEYLESEMELGRNGNYQGFGIR